MVFPSFFRRAFEQFVFNSFWLSNQPPGSRETSGSPWPSWILLLVVLAPASAYPGDVDMPDSVDINSQSEYVRVYWECDRDECDLEKSRTGSNWSVVETSARSRDFYSEKLEEGSYHYRVQVCTTNDGTPTSQGTSYRTHCWPSDEHELTVYRVPSSSPTPSISGSSISTDGRYTVSWGTVSGATDYQLYEKKSGGDWSRVKSHSNRSKSYSKNQPNTYEYAVIACRNGNDKCASMGDASGVTVKAPAGRPSLTLDGRSDDWEFPLEWTEVDHAEHYEIQHKEPGDSNWKALDSQNSLERTIEVESDGRYRYRVRACNPIDCSGYRTSSLIDVARTPEITDTSVPTKAIDGEDVTVSWTGRPASAIDQYRVQVKRKGGDSTWGKTTTTSANHLDISDEIKSEDDYRFRVRAVNEVGNYPNRSDWEQSDPFSASRPSQTPSLSLKSTSSSGSYTVQWDTTDNTTSYRLRQTVTDPQGEESTKTYEVSGTSKGFGGQSDGRYTYRVKACNALGCHNNFSASKSISVAETPVLASDGGLNVPNGNTDGYFRVSWPDYSGISVDQIQYRLQYKEQGESWSQATTEVITDTHFDAEIDENEATAYQFRHRVENQVPGHTEYSDWSATQTVQLAKPDKLAKPDIVDDLDDPGNHFSTSLTLTWDKVDNTRRYELREKKEGSNKWKRVSLDDNERTSYEWEDLHNGFYQYRVAACNKIGCGDFSEAQEVAVAIAPDAPENLVVEDLDSEGYSSGAHLLGWDPPDSGSVNYYQVEENQVSPAKDEWEAKASEVESTGYEVDKKSESEIETGVGVNEYRYRVRACFETRENNPACSEWSDPVGGVKVVQEPEDPYTDDDDPEVGVEPADDGGIKAKWRNLNEESETLQVVGSYGVTQKESVEKPEDIEHWVPLTEDNFGGSLTSAVVDQLGKGKHYFKIGYCNKVGESDDAERCSDASFVPKPSGSPFGNITLRVTDEDDEKGEYTLEWNGIIWGAKHYDLEFYSGDCDGNADDTYKISGVRNGAEDEQGDKNKQYDKELRSLDSGVYCQRVQACNDYGCGEWSNTVTVAVAKPPRAPEFEEDIPDKTDGKVTLEWTVNSGGNSYTKLTKTKSGEEQGETLLDEGDGLETQRTVTVDSPGTYRFELSACVSVGAKTECSDSDTVTVEAVAPEKAPIWVQLAQFNSDGEYSLAWEPVKYADRYKVREYLAEQDDPAQIYQVDAPAGDSPEEIQKRFRDKPDGTYEYRIRACNNLGCSVDSVESTVQVLHRPDQPEELSAAAGWADGQTELNWQAVADPSASYYELQAREEGASWPESAVETTETASFVWPEAVTEASTREYRVRACREASGERVCSEDWSEPATVSYRKPEVPAATDAPLLSANGQYTVEWKSAPRAADYRLLENGVELLREDRNEIAFSGDQVRPTGFYTYATQACNVVGCSDQTSPVTVWVSVDGGANDPSGDEGDGEDTGSGDGSADPTGGTGDNGEGDDPDSGATIEPSGDLGPSPAPETGHTLVGATQGTFRVNESGAATYQIPLQLPKGTADVTPELSFSYSSQGGTGLMGQGWSLGGLSSIGRCRQTKNQDDRARPITWSGSDRLCLDGQRLIQTSSGAYDANGMTYKTEVDSHVEVVVKGGGMNSPSGYFEVRTKDGGTRTYGKGEESRLTTPGGTLTWKQSYFEDNIGNHVVYRYTGDHKTGHRLDEIEYAFSTVGYTTGGRARVELDYENRGHNPTSYVAGYARNQPKRLKTVRIHNTVGNETGEYRRYKLSYQASDVITTDRISRLESIQECAGPDKCLEPTEFSWAGLDSVEITSLEQPEYRQMPEVSEEQQFFASNKVRVASRPDNTRILDYTNLDIDGNGKMDLAWIEFQDGDTGTQTVRYATMNPDTEGYSSEHLNDYSLDLESSGAALSLKALDYNGDGRTDLLIRRENQHGVTDWHLYLAVPRSDGRGWALERHRSDLPILSGHANNRVFSDVDGDGMVDTYSEDDDQVNIQYLSRSNLEPVDSSTPYWFEAGGTDYRYRPSELPALEAGEDDTDDPYWEFGGLSSVASDLSGSGTTDFIFSMDEVRVEWHTGMSEPSPVVAETHQMVFTLNEHDRLSYRGTLPDVGRIVHAVDINGDGLTDLIGRSRHGDNDWKFSLNKGGSWTEPTEITGISPSTPASRVKLADINRDGNPDIVFATPHYGLQVLLWGGNSYQSGRRRFSRNWHPTEHGEHRFVVADLDGDGWQDYMLFDAGTSSWSAYLADHKGKVSPNLMVGIRDGLGQEIAIGYEPLSDTGHYTREDVGEPDLRELDETCIDPPVSRVEAEPSCYTPQEYSLDTGEFYTRLNDPLSTLPEGNDVLDDQGSPVLEQYAPMPMVTDVIRSGLSSDEPNGDARSSYYYGQLKLQAGGRGSLGFKRLISVNHQNLTVTETTYRQDWPFVGSPLKTVTRALVDESALGEGAILSEAVNRWKLETRESPNGNTRYFQTYIKETEETSYEKKGDGTAQGDPVKTVSTETEKDEYGNATDVTVTTQRGNDTHVKYTDNTFEGEGGGAELGRLSSSTVTTTPVDGDPEKQVAEFSYHDSGPQAGMLKTEVRQPNAAKALTKTYEYDAYGNKTQVTYSGADGFEREGERSIYQNGRYLKAKENALGQTTRTVNARNHYGQPTRVTDLHGVATDIEYDALGREQVRKTEASGAWQWQSRRFCADGISCPQGAVYRHHERVAGGGETYTYFDARKRPVRTATLAPQASGSVRQWNIEITRYNERGKKARTSTPFRNTSPEVSATMAEGWTETEYDRFGRPERIILPDGEEGQTFTYDGLSTTTTNAFGHSKTEHHNLQGELALVEDSLGGTIDYQYDTQGNLTRTTTQGANTEAVEVRICYDALGHKKAMFDPDKGGFAGEGTEQCQAIDPIDPPEGWWGYEYNSLGELVEQVDPKGQHRVLTYDALGRKLTRTGYEPDGSVERHTRWFYDGGDGDDIEPDPGQRGQLHQVVQSRGEVDEHCGSENYCQTYAYDELGRQSGTFTFHPTDPETGAGADTGYVTSTSYDAIGRPYVQQDALSGLVHGRSGVHYRYDDHGYRTKVIDLASGDTLKHIVSRNARGQVTELERGNGYTTHFEYDRHFGRLTRQKATPAGSGFFPVQEVEYTWDVLGNLKSRHNQSALKDQPDKRKDLEESFCYDGLNRLINTNTNSESPSDGCDGNHEIEYDGLGNITHKHDVGDYTYGDEAGPHAVTEAGGTTYDYDANGNQISGDGRQLSYTGFDKPNEIRRGDHTTRFEYGPGRDRFRRVDETDPSLGAKTTKTTTYLGDVERIDSSDSDTITWRRTVAGAVYKIKTDKAFNPVDETDKSYIYKDHLGSTDVITGKTGEIRQSMSFDAWGQRRDSESWDIIEDVANFDTDITNDGFTGHEQLDEVGLIHMNGRVYDPKLARFGQADPFIQAPSNTQSYNRYSYVWNNPLNKDDPSGYYVFDILDAVGDSLDEVSLGRHIFREVGYENASMLHSVGTAACGPWAALCAGVGGWNLADTFGAEQSDAIWSGVTGAVSAFAFSSVADTIGSANWATDGGSIPIGGGTKLNATGFTTLVAAQGTVGGIATMAQGGDFKDGFVSAGLSKLASPFLPDTGAYIGDIDVGQVAISAVIGGTSSGLTGGKFANGAITGAFVNIFNQQDALLRDQAECRGMCHEIPGRGKWQPMSYSQNMALASAGLSSVGAGIAGIGCSTSGLSCGLAGVLSVDAGRQFYKAGTGDDPLVVTALDLGATERQAANIALGADILTATTSINGAYKGLLFRSTQNLSAGTVGAVHTDLFSTIHTVGELNRSLEQAQ